MKTMFVAALILIAGQTLLAQAKFSAGMFELQGSVLFNNSERRHPSASSDEIERTIELSFSPTIGYFLSDHWEVFLRPSYLYSIESHDYLFAFSGPSSSQSYQITDQALALAAGFAFHLGLSDRVSSFLSLSAGLEWTQHSLDAIDYGATFTGHSPWTDPTAIFPVIGAGLEIFVADNCAVLPQIRFSRSNAPASTYYRSGTDLSFGLGLAVYLGRDESESTTNE